MAKTKSDNLLRYSISRIRQGRHVFCSATIPSDVLAKCCFVISRGDDSEKGFQRFLDENRAKDIANYIDHGLGTIPGSIVLSAQSEACFEIISGGKTLQFKPHDRAFLIIDGQHRIYGFSMSKSSLRIPVVIYSGLSRRDETRLFIDINSKQKGVPNELLLDIKKLAEHETDIEENLRVIFDLFMNEAESSLFGKLTPSTRAKNKISRVTFNSAVKSIINLFIQKTSEESYEILNAYYTAFIYGLSQIDAEEMATHSTVYKAISAFFSEVASKVKDRYGTDYSADNFYSVLEPMFARIKASRIRRPGNSYKKILNYFSESMQNEFLL